MRPPMATAPHGTYEPFMPLPITSRSGTRPQWSHANIGPVRRNPVITSSTISSTPYASQTSRTSGQ